MSNHLISLVIFFIFFVFSNVLSENNFILPKNKPSVFKKIERNLKQTDIITPSKKPVIEVKKKNTEIKKAPQKRDFLFYDLW